MYKSDKGIRRYSEPFKLKIQRDNLSKTLIEIAKFAASNEKQERWKKLKKNFVNDYN